MVLSGDFLWSWNSFLGAGFVESYSYYTVFNIFAWIAILFPDKYILYGTMFITILKFSISMVSSMLYMKRFCKKDTYALIGALLYTFSGFTLVNTNFYFFLDVICLFPFLMYGLELLIVEDKSEIYVLFVALNAITNYYFFRLNHKFCGISDSSRSSVGSYRIASERNIRHQDIRIPVCEES